MRLFYYCWEIHLPPGHGWILQVNLVWALTLGPQTNSKNLFLYLNYEKENNWRRCQQLLISFWKGYISFFFFLSLFIYLEGGGYGQKEKKISSRLHTDLRAWQKSPHGAPSCNPEITTRAEIKSHLTNCTTQTPWKKFLIEKLVPLLANLPKCFGSTEELLYLLLFLWIEGFITLLFSSFCFQHRFFQRC